MSEKQGYSVLPQTSEDAQKADLALGSNKNEPVNAPRRPLRRFLVKAGLVAAAMYVFLYLPFGSDDDGDNGSYLHLGRHRGRAGCHGKNKKYSFESHMQADVDQLVAGSLES
ncbi:hypothetical protein BGZ98_005739, partial [Dissophora globulifera]